MYDSKEPKVRRFAVLLSLIFIFNIDAVAQEKYSGGNGTPAFPYQIATAQDLIDLGNEPNDYDKHFILTADIDLDPNLPGGKVFDQAVIAPDMNDVAQGFQGTAFSGKLDGQGHVIRNLNIRGKDYLGLVGFLDEGAVLTNLGLEAVDINGIDEHGNGVGGLLGDNYGSVSNCYSIGSVSGATLVGNLVGLNTDGTVSNCFWDIETSGTQESEGGIGLTTGEMQDLNTYLNAGWDFINETDNGTDDIWWIDDGNDYPRLWWEQ